MSLASLNILSHSQALAQQLRREGRVEGAEVVEELQPTGEEQTSRSEYVSVDEAAQRLGISPQTVAKWVKRGFIRGVMLDGRLAVSLISLARPEGVARLLDIIDTDRPPATAEEINQALRAERDTWNWIDRDA